MNVGIIGSGSVGQTLAAGFAKKDHDVVLGTGHPEKNAELTPTGARVGTFQEAAAHGDVIVLCVFGLAGEEVVAGVKDDLPGKLVLDTTNPLDGGPQKPAGMADSLIQRYQAAAPEARFVKAWNCTPGMVMVDPPFEGTQFICGDDEAAKQEAAAILEDFGWESIDIGAADTGPYVEGMALAVINHGMRSGDWNWGLRLMRG